MHKILILLVISASVSFGQSNTVNPYVRPMCSATVTTNCTPQVNGAGAYVPGASPSGAASGDLSGTYPNPTVSGINNTLLSGLGAGMLKQNASGVPSLAVAGTDFVGGQAALTTQYAVPYVSATPGVLAQGTLFQCSSGVVGIGGCTSSYPGLKKGTTNSLIFTLGDDSAYPTVYGGNIASFGVVSTTRRMYSSLDTVTYSATPTFLAEDGNVFKMTLTGNVTSSTLSGAAAGQLIVKEICQDATGSRTYVHPANVINGMTIGSGASSCSSQLYFWDGTYAQALTPGMVSGKPPVTVSGASCTITEITNGLITGATCP